MQDWEQHLGLGEELSWDAMRVAPPDPWAGHIPFAFWLIKALRPAMLVELGTHSGNSYFAFCQAIAACAPGARAFAVDTWQGDPHAGHYGEEVYADVAAFNARHFRGFSTLMRSTFDAARAYFADGSIDLLHIDGMHTHEAVQKDFETWLPALSSRAVVLFHDTNVRERGFGVWRLWRDLVASYPSFEFAHSNGLGVLGVGPDQAPALRALFALDQTPEAAQSFRRRVAARGEAFQRQVEVAELRAQLAHAGDLAGQVQAAQDDLRWRDALLASRQEMAHAAQAQARIMGEVAAARAASLAERDAIIRARDTLAAELYDTIREQRRAVDEARADATGQRLSAERAWWEVAQAQAQAQAVRHEVSQAFVQSTSWRVTAPLRAGLRRLRRAPPMALEQAPPPPALPPPPAPAQAAPDVTAPTPAKLALRGQWQARLAAFLAGPGRLRLPRAERPQVSILLVLYNQAELTFACLSSLIETLGAGPAVETIIVDNDSTDRTGSLLDRLDGATILRNRGNVHFLKGVNQAAREARGRALLLLNNDAQLMPGALASALRTLDADPAIGAVGGRIILPDGTLQEAGSIIWRDGACSGYGRGDDPDLPDYMFQRDVDYCSGAFLLTPRATWEELGGFDERFAPAYYEETDYCVRLWESGRRVVFDPDVAILHYEFASTAPNGEALSMQAANHSVFVQQHADWLAGQYAASPANVLAARAAHDARRVLVIEDRIPKQELGSGYPRANRLVRELAAAGAQVAFFPTNRYPETWHGVRRALDKRVEVLIAAQGDQLHAYLSARRGHFDAILVCRPHNMRMLQEQIGADRALIGEAMVIYDAEAVFATRQLQHMAAEGAPADEAERHRLLAAEVTLTRQADIVISVTPAEQVLMEEYGARRVLPLGHALDEQPIPTGFADRDELVFLGAIHEEKSPNADSLRWFATEILPPLRALTRRPDLRLVVVGLNRTESIKALDGEALDLRGTADDLAAALARARVMVAPTRFAAGMPHKVHQAAMLGIPMVVTSLIAEQLGWRDGAELLVADDAEAFAAACARLLEDRALWERVRGGALARARRECAPEPFARQVRAILDAVPLVHARPPERAAMRQLAPPAAWETQPNTSRPFMQDFSAAVPFLYRPQAPARPVRLAAICHLFHAGLAPEMRYYLNHLAAPADLLLSTDTAEKRATLQEAFADWERGRVEVRVTPNRGRDIAPKLVGFADAYDRYDLVLHLHSKLSDHAPFLAPWRGYLLETLLGSPEIAASIMEAFERLPDLGMVAPQHYEGVRHWLDWRGNFEAAVPLAARMGIRLYPDRALDFPSGSMFWARPAALRPLLDLHLSFDDFPAEGAQIDRTPAHAIERLYFHVCERSGHSWMKVAQPALCSDPATVTEIGSPAALSRFVAEHGVLLSGPARVPCAPEPLPLVMKVAPGLSSRLAARSL